MGIVPSIRASISNGVKNNFGLQKVKGRKGSNLSNTCGKSMDARLKVDGHGGGGFRQDLHTCLCREFQVKGGQPPILSDLEILDS